MCGQAIIASTQMLLIGVTVFYAQIAIKKSVLSGGAVDSQNWDL